MMFRLTLNRLQTDTLKVGVNKSRKKNKKKD